MVNLLSRRDPRPIWTVLRASAASLFHTAQSNTAVKTKPTPPPLREVALRPRIPLPSHVVVPHPFPPEIWELIMTFLRADGRSHAVISAVSRTMRAVVMPYYFQSVALQGWRPIARFLEAFEGSGSEDCPVQTLLLTGCTHDIESQPRAPEPRRSLINLPFATLHNRLLRLVSPSLKQLTVTYTLNHERRHYSLLPATMFPHLRTLVAQAKAFNSQPGPLPYTPSLRCMYLYGASLDHGSFDVLCDFAPELEELRIVHLPGNEHYVHDIGYLLGMDQYTRVRYTPSKRRLTEAHLKLYEIPFAKFKYSFGPLRLGSELYDNPPELPCLKKLRIDRLPSAELEEITNHSPGRVQLTIQPCNEYDGDAAVGEW